VQNYIAEFVGTLLLVLLGNGVVANVVLPRTKGHGAGWVAISFGWGMAVFVGVWCVAPVSGAHLNPAVTIGLAVGGKFAAADVLPFVVSQMLGAIAGAVLVYLTYRDHYLICDDADAKLATFATGPAIRNLPNNLLSEVVGTTVLVLAILLAADPTFAFDSATADSTDLPDGEIGLGTLGALPVGLLVLAIGLSLGGTTGYAINPARDLGPRIAHALLPIPDKRDSDWGYSSVPVVGPILGGVLAAVIYRLMAAE
jgi:glycerol uptake facilitator protein